MTAGFTAGLTPLELACGAALGTVAPPALPSGREVRVTAAQALEDAILPALQHAPCLVSFSGGIDSSVVLSAAVRAARRHRLPDPVPFTWRVRDAPQAEESAWQERVVAELRLSDWIVEHADDELDFVGPVAQRLLRRHGVLFPANAHLHGPVLARGRGGSVLTGIGGDQILGLGRWRRAARILAGTGRPTLGEFARVALSASPAPVRRRLDPGRDRLASDWLAPAVAHTAARRHAAERASEPLWWASRVRWQLRRRDLVLGLRTLERLAADAGTNVACPFVDPRFVAAVARAGGQRGFAGRRQAVAALLGDVVPAAVIPRRDKARFGEVFWRSPSRALARDWDGCGVDPSLVDPVALRALWRDQRTVPLRTALLLQQVWLRAAQAPAAAKARASATGFAPAATWRYAGGGGR